MTSLSLKPHRITRAARILGAVLVAALAYLALAGPAAANTPCGKKVLADWWDNGRVDKLYPLHCYEDAIDAIPTDIRDYSDAEQIISRALQAAVGGKLAPGGSDPSPDDRSPSVPVTPDPGDPGTGSGVASGAVDSSSPSSVPIPLIVLGGMSLALLAAGGIGYVSRRRRDGHGDDSDDAGFAG